MSDTPIEPKKSKWLQEVEDDAVRITNRRFNQYFEDQALEEAKKKAENPQQAPEKPILSGGATYEPQLTMKGSK